VERHHEQFQPLFHERGLGRSRHHYPHRLRHEFGERSSARRNPQFGKVGFAASLKWLPQIGAQHTVKGDYIWLKLGMSF